MSILKYILGLLGFLLPTISVLLNFPLIYVVNPIMGLGVFFDMFTEEEASLFTFDGNFLSIKFWLLSILSGVILFLLGLLLAKYRKFWIWLVVIIIWILAFIFTIGSIAFSAISSLD
ncbi:hypothetical protein GF406_16175 [candidate division KSB1 bacterium]|nr:hypothetical protein [candidate division KSB1 bacterium]